MPSRIRYICGGTGPPRLLSYCFRCRHAVGNVFWEVWCLWLFWGDTLYILYMCGGRHCSFFCYVVILSHVKAVNTVCRWFSLRFGFGFLQVLRFIIRTAALSVTGLSAYAAVAVLLSSRCQSSLWHGLAPVRLSRGLHAWPRLLLTIAKLR